LRLIVKLRDHPLLTSYGIPSWPPVWCYYGKDGSERLKGEIGVLRRVTLNELASKNCFLTIEHEGSLLIGCLLVADRAFCHHIAKLLQSYCGRPIEEIGGIDFGHNL
jgi:hypothetical protein